MSTDYNILIKKRQQIKSFYSLMVLTLKYYSDSFSVHPIHYCIYW